MHITERLLRKIFDENYYNLYGYANSIVHNDQDAHEIALEAFVRLWLHQAAIESEAHIRPYLFITVRNLCTDYIKQRRHEPFDDTILLLPLTVEPDVYEKFENTEKLKWLEKQIAKLSKRERQAFDLWMAGLDNHAIADRLGLHESYVRTLKTRIIDRLRDAKNNGG